MVQQRELVRGKARSQFSSGHMPDSASGYTEAGLAGWHVLLGEARSEILEESALPPGVRGRVPPSQNCLLRSSFCSGF